MNRVLLKMTFLLEALLASKLDQDTQALVWTEVFCFFFTETSEYMVSEIYGNINR